jgi:hypothetical protein
VTSIAERLIVVEVSPSLWSVLDGLDVVCVQVLLVRIASPSQFIEHILTRWKAEKHLAVVAHDVRFPTAIHTAPTVAFKAKDSQSSMSGIVSALGTAAAPRIVLLLARTTVHLTAPSGRERTTARLQAWSHDYCETPARATVVFGKDQVHLLPTIS